jgi:hypothetical protein
LEKIVAIKIIMAETAANVDISSTDELTTTKTTTALASNRVYIKPSINTIQSKIPSHKKTTTKIGTYQKASAHKENIPEKRCINPQISNICHNLNTPVINRDAGKPLTPTNAKPLFGSSTKKEPLAKATTARNYDQLKNKIKSLKNDKYAAVSSSSSKNSNTPLVNKTPAYGVHKNDLVYVKTPVAQRNNFNSASKTTPKYAKEKDEISFE